MKHNTEVRAVSAPWHAGVELLVRCGTAVGVSVTMEEADPSCVVQPTLTISRREAQTLMDDLWGAGLRPTEGSGSAGSQAATERHLKDMRRIAFKQLDMVCND